MDEHVPEFLSQAGLSLFARLGRKSLRRKCLAHPSSEGRMMTKQASLPVYDYTVLKSVRAVCPRCFSDDPDFDPEYPTDILDGHLVGRAGQVFLRRYCRRGHGEVWSLYEE